MVREDALAQLQTMVAADTPPRLDPTELQAILDESASLDDAGNPPANTADTATTWTASTTVDASTVIAVDGRYWRCRTGGVTAATEPNWPDLAGSRVTTVTVTDGDAVWIDNGTEWAGTWDLDVAAMLGWERKAGLAVSFDFKTEDQQFSRSQLAEQCRKQAAVYSDRIVNLA